jgi:hypothetical protein
MDRHHCSVVVVVNIMMIHVVVATPTGSIRWKWIVSIIIIRRRHHHRYMVTIDIITTDCGSEGSMMIVTTIPYTVKYIVTTPKWETGWCLLLLLLMLRGNNIIMYYGTMVRMMHDARCMDIYPSNKMSHFSP